MNVLRHLQWLDDRTDSRPHRWLDQLTERSLTGPLAANGSAEGLLKLLSACVRPRQGTHLRDGETVGDRERLPTSTPAYHEPMIMYTHTHTHAHTHTPRHTHTHTHTHTWCFDAFRSCLSLMITCSKLLSLRGFSGSAGLTTFLRFLEGFTPSPPHTPHPVGGSRSTLE